MRKNLTIFCGLALSLCMAGSALAQNANAFYKIDTDLTTVGYQETSKPMVKDIGATKLVGFALYAQEWQNAKGFTVKFEWDGAKASFRSTSSTKIDLDELNINGVAQTPATEQNILGGSLISAGETNSTGVYSISWAQGGGAAATSPTGLIYFAVFRTSDTFKTEDLLSIKCSVTVADENGVERFLGYRYFNVNQVDVKESTWGNVKSQFKDF